MKKTHQQDLEIQQGNRLCVDKDQYAGKVRFSKSTNSGMDQSTLTVKEQIKGEINILANFSLI